MLFRKQLNLHPNLEYIKSIYFIVYNSKTDTYSVYNNNKQLLIYTERNSYYVKQNNNKNKYIKLADIKTYYDEIDIEADTFIPDNIITVSPTDTIHQINLGQFEGFEDYYNYNLIVINNSKYVLTNNNYMCLFVYSNKHISNYKMYAAVNKLKKNISTSGILNLLKNNNYTYNNINSDEFDEVCKTNNVDTEYECFFEFYKKEEKVIRCVEEVKFEKVKVEKIKVDKIKTEKVKVEKIKTEKVKIKKEKVVKPKVDFEYYNKYDRYKISDFATSSKQKDSYFKKLPVEYKVEFEEKCGIPEQISWSEFLTEVDENKQKLTDEEFACKYRGELLRKFLIKKFDNN